MLALLCQLSQGNILGSLRDSSILHEGLALWWQNFRRDNWMKLIFLPSFYSGKREKQIKQLLFLFSGSTNQPRFCVQWSQLLFCLERMTAVGFSTKFKGKAQEGIKLKVLQRMGWGWVEGSWVSVNKTGSWILWAWGDINREASLEGGDTAPMYRDLGVGGSGEAGGAWQWSLQSVYVGGSQWQQSGERRMVLSALYVDVNMEMNKD